VQIFLSYSKADQDVGARIATGLRAEGHEVFFDQTDLPPGDSYDDRIRDAVRSSDLLLFLVSPDSVEKGRYTRTELSHARHTWPDPSGRVLPVMVRPTPYENIPSYLKTVTVLEPMGNVPADVAAAVERLDRASWRPDRRRLKKILLGAAVLVVLAAAAWLVARQTPEDIGEGPNGGPGTTEQPDDPQPDEPQPDEPQPDEPQPGDEPLERRYLVEWFRDYEASECEDMTVSHPGGLLVARAQNNERFVIDECNLQVEAAVLELIGDVRIRAFAAGAPGRGGAAAAGDDQPRAEGFDNRDGIDGAPGSPGANGRAGRQGRGAGVVELRVGGWRGEGTLTVDLRGQNGGSGQDGGRGGRGQAGARGAKAESGVVSCAKGPGTGGNGGPGGRGGNGGGGGDGGEGGLLYVSDAARRAFDLGHLQVEANGGRGGAAGSGGECGAPGEAGPRGLGSRLCRVEDPPWRWGSPGEGCLGSGADGRPGEDGSDGQVLDFSNGG
jgi:hypothetical protein